MSSENSEGPLGPHLSCVPLGKPLSLLELWAPSQAKARMLVPRVISEESGTQSKCLLSFHKQPLHMNPGPTLHLQGGGGLLLAVALTPDLME